MSAHDIANDAERTRAGKRRWFGAASSLAGWLGVALMPKCPLCVAVALSGLGVGATWAAALSPYMRGAAWAIAGLALLVTLVVEGRRIVRRRTLPGARVAEPSCCALTPRRSPLS